MFRKRHPGVGARPGTLVINGASPKPIIRVFDYRPDDVTECEISDVADLRGYLSSDTVSWIDVQGFGDLTLIQQIGDLFRLHPLVLEDVVNVPQRPKVEQYDDQVLWITRMAMADKGRDLQAEQVSLIIGPNYLLTFQECYGDVLNPVRRRIREGKGPIRRSGPDYLAYAIVDAVIDGYYPLMESFGERLECMEQQILDSPHASQLQDIHRVKRDLLGIRRAVWPQREAVNSMIRGDISLISENVRTYLRDVYDHCVQLIDVIETFRELTGGLMDLYLSSLSNRQNEVMKVLTIMASIFIPLSFLAGLYGMNFENMPELHVPWAYPLLLVVMVLTVFGMLTFFRKKGWLGSSSSKAD